MTTTTTATTATTRNARVVAAFVCLPLAVLCERFAWTVTSFAVRERYTALQGDLADGFFSSFAAGIVGAILAGVLAIVLLPRVVLVAAGVAAAAGYFVAASANDATTLNVGMYFASAGAAALKVSIFALAVWVMPSARLRVLYMLTSSLAANVGLSLFSPLGAVLASEFDSAGAIAIGGGAVLVGLVPAVIVVVVDKLASASATTSTPPPPTTTSRDWARAGVAALTFAAALLPLFMPIARLVLRVREVGGEVSSIGLVFAAGTLATIAATASFGVWLTSRTSGGDGDAKLPRMTLVVGAALAVSALGSLLVAMPTMATAVLGQLCYSLATVGAPIAMCRALTNQHPRATTLVAAFVMFAPWCAAGIPLDDVVGSSMAYAMTAVVAGAAAFVLVRVGAKLEAWLDATTAAPPESWLHGQR